MTGFAAKIFLRLPTTSHREALLAAVHREYMRFDRGLGQEHVKPFAGYVGDMWMKLKLPRIDMMVTPNPRALRAG